MTKANYRLVQTVSLLIGAIFVLSAIAAEPPKSQPERGGEENLPALLNAVAKSKISLAEAVKKATKENAVAIAAKFDYHRDGSVTLDVFVAANGLEADAAHNSFLEVKFNPNDASAAPVAEPMTQPARVARAAEQLTLMRLANKPLTDLIAVAEKAAFGSTGGTVFAIRPEIEKGRGIFDVEVAKNTSASKVFLGLDGKVQLGFGGAEEEEMD